MVSLNSKKIISEKKGFFEDEGLVNDSKKEDEKDEEIEDLANYNDAIEGRIIAINEGRLVEFLKTTSKHQQLHDSIDDYFYNEGQLELPEGMMIINLNLRSVAALSKNEPSLFRQQIKALTNKTLWRKCEDCAMANRCFINITSIHLMILHRVTKSLPEWSGC